MTRKLTNGINVDALDQEIKDLGVRIKLYKSTLCPNMDSLESNDHDVNCQVCNNRMIDFDPCETVALFQQQNLAEQFKVQGTFHLDEVMVTFLSGQTLSTYTRIDLLDFKEDFYELIQRQEGTDTDLLKYRACSIDAVFVVVGNTLTRYHEGTDFVLDVNGSINWISAHRPNARQNYSIYYKYRPIYRAVKAMHRDRFSQNNSRPQNIQAPKTTVNGTTYVKLPETWVLKRDYLVERRDSNNNKLTENTYYNPND